MPASDDENADTPDPTCPHCGAGVDADDLGCAECGEPLDDPARGICAFCGVATSERCGGCALLICWECSDGARSGTTSVFAGTPFCADCRAGAAV